MPNTFVPIETFSPASRTTEVDGLRIFDGRFPAELSLPSHYHEGPSVFVILEGSLVETFAGRNCECSAATVLAKPAGERHSDRLQRAGARALAVEPDPRRAADLRPYLKEEIIHFTDRRVESLARQIAVELRAADAAARLALEGLALELLAAVARRRERDGGAKPQPPWLARSVELLHESFASPLRVSEIAAEVGVHPVHLARVFRAHHRRTIGEYVRQLRLEWAATELATTSHSISDIALSAGFSDQSHFTRAFKRYASVTPLRYRQERKR